MQVEVVIPASNNASAKWESVYPDLNVNAFVKALAYSFPIPLAATNPSLARTTFQEYLANMLAGKYASAQEAMDAAKAAMDAAIKG
jgi:multiple sugar transport system substrate-binding protein